MGAEYDKSEDDSEKEWSWRVRYAGKFGESDKQQYNGGGENYQPSDYFFAPAEREYGQRIRTVTLAADVNAAGSPPRLWGIAPSALPMTVHSGEGAVSLTIFGASDSGQRPYSLTLVRGEYGAKKISIVLPPLPYYSIPTEQTATIYHASGAAVSLVFPNSGATVEVTSTVIVASSPRDYFRLVDGGAQHCRRKRLANCRARPVRFVRLSPQLSAVLCDKRQHARLSPSRRGKFPHGNLSASGNDCRGNCVVECRQWNHDNADSAFFAGKF